MNVFRKKFFTLINEDEQETPAGEDLGLEPETPSDTFNDVEDNPMVSFQKQQNANTISSISGWVEQVEGFISFLNGLDDGSVNSQINKADCDSIMADIQRSESKKISRLAQDLSSLSESLKQYLIVANNKQQQSNTI